MLPKLNLPEFSLTLPVTGDQITYKPYTAGQQKLLLIAKESENELEILSSIQRITKECTNGFDTSSLCSTDFEYLYLKLRAASEGELVPVRVTHSENTECNFEHIFDINLNEVDVEEVPKENVLTVNDEIGLTLRYPSIRDFEAIKNYSTATEMTYYMLRSCIENVFDAESTYYLKDSPDEEVIQFFESLSPEIVKGIETFLSTMPVVSINISYECPKCGEKVEKKITQINNFF